MTICKAVMFEHNGRSLVLSFWLITNPCFADCMQGCASKAPFVVLVTDTCKACAANQININALTYEKYISATNGQMAISWQKVSQQVLSKSPKPNGALDFCSARSIEEAVRQSTGTGLGAEYCSVLYYRLSTQMQGGCHLCRLLKLLGYPESCYMHEQRGYIAFLKKPNLCAYCCVQLDMQEIDMDSRAVCACAVPVRTCG